MVVTLSKYYKITAVGTINGVLKLHFFRNQGQLRAKADFAAVVAPGVLIIALGSEEWVLWNSHLSQSDIFFCSARLENGIVWTKAEVQEATIEATEYGKDADYIQLSC